MTTQASQIEVPENWEGSIPEWVAYSTFISLGKEPGEDFTYQSPLMGGRLDKGGVVLDFMSVSYTHLTLPTKRIV